MVPGGGTVGLQMDISFVSTPLIEQRLVGGNCTVDHGSCADDVLLFEFRQLQAPQHGQIRTFFISGKIYGQI